MKKSYLLASVVLAVIVLITACYGIFTFGVYSAETANWATQIKAQDYADLIIVAPLLLISSIMAYRGSFAARAVWLGVLFFNVYSFLIYAFMVHFNSMFILYVASLGISCYLLIFALVNFDYKRAQLAFNENWSRKAAAYLLITFGILFYLVWLKDVVPGLLNAAVPSSIKDAGLFTNGVWVIDMALYLPFLILAGWYLLKKKTQGYVIAGGALVFCGIMTANIALIIYYLNRQALAADNSLAYIFGSLCLITVGLTAKYLRSFNKC